MNRETELALIDELLALKADKSFYLDEAVSQSPVEHYTSQDRFEREQTALFRRYPSAVAHVSELAEPGAFLRCTVAGQSVLVTRDKSGEINAFLNVCRHRGTRLVDEETGCKHRFTCPYHAWTYASSGELIAAPHFDEGFVGKEKADFGLIKLDCFDLLGLIWVSLDGYSSEDFRHELGPLASEMEALGIDEMFVAQSDTTHRNANWKVLIEGGIEAYHFKVAHKNTIGPFFEDNLSSYQTFGPHMRSVLPRVSMSDLSPETRETWRLRAHANIIYTTFPTSQFLVQQDHVVWISQQPVSPSETKLRLATLAPKKEAHRSDHWARNHNITMTTLEEDFAIGESVQSSFASGANTHLTFGRFEGALTKFNACVDKLVDGQTAQAAAAE